MADQDTQRSVIGTWRARWSEEPYDWRHRFEPALIGLERVLASERFDEAGRIGNGRRFLGWSVGPHWLHAPQ